MRGKVTTEVTTPRNSIMYRCVSAMLGVRFGLTRDYSQGILSPSFGEVSPEQKAIKGLGKIWGCTEAHTHLNPSYHNHYHAPDLYSPAPGNKPSHAFLCWKVLW